MPETGDAPVILSNEPGSFACGVLDERHPALIERVRAKRSDALGRARGRASIRSDPAETLDTYGYLLWEVDWENAPASFEELYGIPAPAGLPQVALVPRAERERPGVGAAA